MSQQPGQWESWQQQPERRGPVVGDHSLNPLKSDLSSVSS